MARAPSGSYNHKIKYERPDEYVISWVVDFKYGGSRLRYPQGRRRDTNEKGARRFAKKWGIEMPEPPKPTK